MNGRKRTSRTPRKPHSVNAGYICELKNRLTGIGHVVIYIASEQGIDVGDNKYAIVCETHGTMTGTTSLPKARKIMKMPDFCEDCIKTARPGDDPDPADAGEHWQPTH